MSAVSPARRVVPLMMIGCSLVMALLLSSCERPPEVPTANPAIAKHALVVSIDGCRPDVLLRADAPNIRALMARGSFTFWARTTAASITLPSHTSMLTGVPPEVHGITWNDNYEGPVIYPNVPTIFEIAKSKGLTTAMYACKTKFVTLARPGSVDWAFITPEKTFYDDDVIAAEAVKGIIAHKPNVTFVHLGAVDTIGHASYYTKGDWAFKSREDEGWGSNEQLLGVRRADKYIGDLVAALKVAGIYDDTLIIVTADHGGAGIGHQADDPRSRHIPWVCAGPGVREDYDLTRDRALVVHTEDTFATVSYFLGLPINPHIMGRPVMQVLEVPEVAAGQ